MLGILSDTEMLREIYITMITPQHARGFGRGPLKKLPVKGYKPIIEVAIDQRGSLGWQVKDSTIADPAKQWVDFDYVGIEATIVNYQIREVKIDEAKKKASQQQIAELEEEIEALANKPDLQLKKEKALAEEILKAENAESYVYLRLIDRQHQYSIRMRPDNTFAISLFNQLRLIVTQDQDKKDRNDHRLYHAVKVGIEKRPSSTDSNKAVTFGTVWTLGDEQVWVGKDEIMRKEDWRPIWKDVVKFVGEYVQNLHNQPNLESGNRAIAARQVALPPTNSPEKVLLSQIQEAANEAYNNADLTRLQAILARVTNGKKTIDSLGSLVVEARGYIQRAINLLADPDVIDVATESVSDQAPPAPKPSTELIDSPKPS